MGLKVLFILNFAGLVDGHTDRQTDRQIKSRGGVWFSSVRGFCSMAISFFLFFFAGDREHRRVANGMTETLN